MCYILIEINHTYFSWEIFSSCVIHMTIIYCFSYSSRIFFQSVIDPLFFVCLHSVLIIQLIYNSTYPFIQSTLSFLRSFHLYDDILWHCINVNSSIVIDQLKALPFTLPVNLFAKQITWIVPIWWQVWPLLG